MGAGSSTLPAKLTEKDLQKLCKELYNSFKDSDGFIDREALIHAAFSGQEKEVHDLFMNFANPDGLMDNNGFFKLCKCAKIMNKNNFTHADAVRVFERSRMSVNVNAGGRAKDISVINYNIFRTLLMPDIASMKQLHLDNLIFKLSRVEAHPPLLFIPLPKDEDLGAVLVDDVDIDDEEEEETKNSNEEKAEEKDVPGALQIDVSEDVKAKGDKIATKGVEETLHDIPLTPEQHKAVHRIQSVSRRLIAQHIVHEMKVVRATALSVNEEDFDKTSAGVDIEMRLQRMFNHFCRNGEMDSNKFVKLCRDSDLTDRFFTIIDVELCFLKAKLKANSTKEYKNHIFHSKRVGYKVFREILLRCVMERKKCSMDKLIHNLLNAEDVISAELRAQQGTLKKGVSNVK
mmetsp:Transcript_2082/g.3741  ORF Transcript_2082/g.3741 Transcript_2082/m.3741 type:complete len:402 (-) Transcript_2082:205-1410(-)|eukprot:CAMPEP_0114427282 /NCGR_PEP_ID=MMETSP0103-20121206/8258_1 /TAXON_ID=37642 ORGANISM="Paraphysomonas imperforata, Strain PA2" /NCGR_SAMPLE_ID=MMETSP0103 /ASSEMBLY_ACC=CAM_ASM_000201 /LENGTH=401 /DNA_ID=CAMNT_0001596319 /DNA_START=90 /DNA_END=1295 /DNA_ORIENTATION=-